MRINAISDIRATAILEFLLSDVLQSLYNLYAWGDRLRLWSAFREFSPSFIVTGGLWSLGFSPVIYSSRTGLTFLDLTRRDPIDRGSDLIEDSRIPFTKYFLIHYARLADF